MSSSSGLAEEPVDPTKISPRELEAVLERNGAIRHIEQDTKEPTVIDNVLVKHPYQENRFITEGRVGPASKVKKDKEVGQQAVNDAFTSGIAQGVAGMKPGSASEGIVKPAAPAKGPANRAMAARNITISGTMTEEQFKASVKTEPGQYVYVIVDAHGNELKPGITGDPYARFNAYVTKEGMATAQMRVYPAQPGYQARGSETAGIASHMESGGATMNVRTETRAEMRQGAEWADTLHQPLTRPASR